MQQMKKINFFTYDDILQKRTLRSFNKKQSSAFNRNNKIISYQQDDDVEVNENQLLMNIMEEFKATKKNSQKNFSNQIKTNVVEVMSKKMNLHLNGNKIIPKMKIKKTQQIEIIEKLNTKSHQANGSLQARKIESLIRRSSKCLLQPKRLSYFVLSGSIHIFEKQQQNLRKKNHEEEQPSTQVSFFNWKQFELQHPGFKKINTYGQFTGFGNAFFPKLIHDQIHEHKGQSLSQQLTKNPQFILAEGAIFIEIENPQAGDDFINHMGMDYDKMTEAILHFSIFKSLGKKIRNFVQFFEFKEYLKNQQIYSIGDEVKKFYLLLKGEVVFEHNKANHIQTAVASPIGSRKNSSHMHFIIKTETMSSGNYFGQEEIIFQKSQRMLTARCKSPKSHILQIPIDKFNKMLEYSDFYDCIKKAAQIKFQQRFEKLEKNQEIRNKFAFSESKDDKYEEVDLTPQIPSENQTVPLFGSPKKSFDGKFKMMHGNMIRQFTQQQKQKMGQTVQFSMLKVNPDMYEKTVDKFRKYKMKPAQKYKPQISWQLKRVWKVLNLENVLRQETEINSPEGRKFYDSHQRYMYHIRESKSMRPKTTSSNYRTKLQYIAYLQQFKRDNK